MIFEPRLVGTALDPARERPGCVRRLLRAEQIERRREPEIDVALDRWQIDHAVLAQQCRIVRLEVRHLLQRAADHPGDAGLADEHVMGFLRQHEAAGPGQRIESRFRQAHELILAVAVGEVSKHEKAQPIVDRLVEGSQNARIIRIARMAVQQLLRLFPAVASEIAVQQIDHRPEMTSFFHVDLEQVPQVVERRAGQAETPLLLDRGGLRIPLGHDQAAQDRAVLARHPLPGRLAEFVAEADGAVLFLIGEEDAPAIVRHLDLAERRPARGIHRRRRPQIDIGALEAFRPQVLPPVEEFRLPMFERPLQRPVAAEIDVVRNAFLIVDRHGSISFSSRTRPGCRCRRASGPLSRRPHWDG